MKPMKKMKTTNGWISAVVMAILLAGVSACNLRSDTKETGDSSETYLTEKKQEVIMEFQHRLQIAESEINKIKADVEQMGMEAKQTAVQKVNHLQSRYESLDKELHELTNASGDAWEELKSGLEDALAEIEGSIENARQEFEDK